MAPCCITLHSDASSWLNDHLPRLIEAGPIFLQRMIALQGTELVEEWRALQAQATFALCLVAGSLRRGLEQAQPQKGAASHFRRRLPGDSELDPQRSLA